MSNDSAGRDELLPEDVMRPLRESRDIAMRFAVEARIPECGEFVAIAQRLDYAIGEIDSAYTPRAELEQYRKDAERYRWLRASIQQSLGDNASWALSRWNGHDDF